MLPLGRERALDVCRGPINAIDRLADLAVADDQRRQQPHHVVASRHREQVLGTQCIDKFGVGDRGAQPKQQAIATHFRNHVAVAVMDFGKPLLEQQRLLAHAFQESGREQHIQHGVADRHRHRISAKGRTVRTRDHPLAGVRRRKTCSDRKTAAETFRQSEDVGRDARALISEEMARASNAGLHLIEYQQQTMLIAERAQALQERIGDHPHTTFALDRLDQDRGRFRGDRALDDLDVAKRNVIKTFGHRTEAIEIFLVASGSERGQRAAMECALEGDDPVAFGVARRGMVLAGDLDAAFHRLGAGIAEEHQIGKRDRAEPVSQALCFRHAIEIGDVPDLVSLRGQRLEQMRMCMPQDIDGNTTGAIEVAFPGRGEQPSPFTAFECNVGARVCRQ